MKHIIFHKFFSTYFHKFFNTAYIKTTHSKYKNKLTFFFIFCYSNSLCKFIGTYHDTIACAISCNKLFNQTAPNIGLILMLSFIHCLILNRAYVFLLFLYIFFLLLKEKWFSFSENDVIIFYTMKMN